MSVRGDFMSLTLPERVGTVFMVCVLGPIAVCVCLVGIGMAVVAGRFAYDAVVSCGRPSKQCSGATCSVADLYEADPRIDQ